MVDPNDPHWREASRRVQQVMRQMLVNCPHPMNLSAPAKAHIVYAFTQELRVAILEREAIKRPTQASLEAESNDPR